MSERELSCKVSDAMRLTIEARQRFYEAALGSFYERGAVHPLEPSLFYPRICLSCGARESLDGSLPCGH
ncbi:hypothetical protein [Paraburkholderia xenovorans]